MTKKVTNFLFSFILFSGALSAQVMNNFETINPGVATRYGAQFSVVNNPSATGLNTSAKVGKIGRTSNNWYELITFPANFTIPANKTKYLHVFVNYPAQPDVSIRIDAADTTRDGTLDIRSLSASKYTTFNTWFDLVFKMDGGTAGKDVKTIHFLPDLGFQNVPVGRILDNATKFAYVDGFIVNDSETSTTVNVKDVSGFNSINVFPNPTSDMVTFSNLNIDSDITVTNVEGKEMSKSVKIKSETLSLPVNNWGSGIYFLTIEKDGKAMVKKFIVE